MLSWTLLGSLGFLSTAKSLQSCPTLCDPIDDSPPGSAIPGILQARTSTSCPELLAWLPVLSAVLSFLTTPCQEIGFTVLRQVDPSLVW